MSSTGTVVLRRTWPQRLVILCTVGLIAASVSAAWFLNDVYESVSEIGRVPISGEILFTDTAPGEPVNFLLIGTDSALGLDADDPILIGRKFDPDGRFFADSITILRVNPETGQAWVLSLPRDLLVERNGEKNINTVYFLEQAPGLIEAITENFGITINHFVALDFVGFRDVVDELGGIPVWFNRPARDVDQNGVARSGLNIPTAGCHVLGGVEALQYVRSRHYQELNEDGEWVRVGANDDFGRIQRQQDFLVLALDRAIDRGARNPTDLASLIGAAALSVQLDAELTVAELADVGRSFSEFSPENLERFGLRVDTVFDQQGDYVGERPIQALNDDVLAIFRGVADLRPADEIDFSLYVADEGAGNRIAGELEAQQFEVAGVFAVDAVEAGNVEAGNVVVYPAGERASAETIARYLEPIPRLVEDPDATSISLVLGTDHEQVLFLFPHTVPKMRAAVSVLGIGPIPTLNGAVELGTTTTQPSTTTVMPAELPTSTTTSTTTTTTIAVESGPPTTTGVIGRAPEGQSCG